MAAKHGMNSKALWGSKESQEIRFSILKKIFLSKSNFTVIDYGCGLAHFYKYLINEGFSNFEYIGVEINDHFIMEIKNQNPSLRIEKGSIEKITKIINSEQVDYVVSSGIYNLGENRKVVQSKFLSEYTLLFEKIHIGCASNFLSDLSENKDNSSIYHNSSELISNCQKIISKNIVYFHNYLPHDFTILIYKKNAI